MSWTDERVELLRKLWAEGLSASQIAHELANGITRNAVIGKVHRLGMSGRVKAASSVSSRPRMKSMRPAHSRPSTPIMRGNTALALRPQPMEAAAAHRGDRHSDLGNGHDPGAEGSHVPLAGRRPDDRRVPFLRRQEIGNGDEVPIARITAALPISRCRSGGARENASGGCKDRLEAGTRACGTGSHSALPNVSSKE